MIKTLLFLIIFAFAFFGMNCNPPADYAVVGGNKLAFDGYSQDFEKLRVIIQSGINKSSSQRLEKSFVVSHKLEKEVLFNVYAAVLQAKGKSFEGKILSTVFSETSKSPKGVGGTMRIEWNFDESIETLFAEEFTITFKTKLDGKEEDATLKFQPK